MRGLLVLWDVDFTLLNAGGASRRIYQVVFRQLFSRDLLEVAPMAGRTDRAIVLDTLGMAGISDPHQHVDEFLAALADRAPVFRAMVGERGHALPGAAAALAAVAALSRAASPATEGHPHRAPAKTPGPGPAAGDSRAAGPGHAAGDDPAIIVQSVLTGNVRPIAEAKLVTLGLADHLDLDIGAYGDHHEVRAELVHLARRQARLAYGPHFAGQATVLVGDTPLDVAAARATGARSVGVATGGFSTTELTAAGADAVLPNLTDPAAVVAAIVGSCAA